MRDTWTLIDLKLGAYVRGQLLLIALVAVVLSLAFWAIGLPYWILVGCFAGIVEIVPVIGPLTAGALAVGVGLTVSPQLAVEAGAVVLAMRLLEDYLIMPRVLGDAVGLTPMVVLVSVTSVGILLGGFAVILAIPLAAVISTLIDVVVRGRDPAEEEVPTVLFPATDGEVLSELLRRRRRATTIPAFQPGARPPAGSATVVDVDAAARDQPGCDRVRVPHLARAEHRRDPRPESAPTAPGRGVASPGRIGGQQFRGRRRPRPMSGMTPSGQRRPRTEDAETPAQRCPTAPSADHAALGTAAVGHRRHLDREPSVGHVTSSAEW